MHPEIRDAQASDAESIARLIAVLGYPMEASEVVIQLKVYGDESSRVFVALWDNHIVGFLSFHAIPLFHESTKLGRITAMAIDPLFQRKGIGRSLVKAAEDFAEVAGCSRMEVTSGDRRKQDAHPFYLSQEYRLDCRRFLKILIGGESGGR